LTTNKQVRSISQLKRELNKNDLFFLGEYVTHISSANTMMGQPKTTTSRTNGYDNFVMPSALETNHLRQMSRIDSAPDDDKVVFVNHNHSNGVTGELFPHNISYYDILFLTIISCTPFPGKRKSGFHENNVYKNNNNKYYNGLAMHIISAKLFLIFFNTIQVKCNRILKSCLLGYCYSLTSCLLSRE